MLIPPRCPPPNASVVFARPLSAVVSSNYTTQGVVGISGTNEGGTTGVGNAINENRGSSRVIGVGFDKSDAILHHIRNGNLLCTMAQNPYVMGYEGMKSAVAICSRYRRNSSQ